MELKIIPHNKSLYLPMGFIIRNESPTHWVNELQRLQVRLENISCYAIPGKVVNSIWGCFIAFKEEYKVIQNNPHLVCQLMNDKIYLPNRSILYPRITPQEISQLFPGEYSYLVHPEVGFVPLEFPVSWAELILPKQSELTFSKPKKGVFIPDELKRLQVKPKEPEEILQLLDKELNQGRSTASDKPLTGFEKIKLSLLKRLMRNKDTNQNSRSSKSNWFNRILGKAQNEIVQQLEDLEERNKKSMDKLMDLFRKNPNEALKYAIPLDEGEASRSPDEGLFEFMKRWTDFSLLGNSGTSNSTKGGSAALPKDHYSTLRDQYTKTATELEKQGDFKKAAFVYLQLLKNPFDAAKALEKGKFYQEAASLYLNKLNDKSSAAKCYEDGRMTEKAIKLYKDLGKFEKVGDLYSEINKPHEALEMYELVVKDYKDKSNYIRAGEVLKIKIRDEERFSNLMKAGWIDNIQSNQCLDQLFESIEDQSVLKSEIEDVYSNHTNEKNIESFLNILVKEFKRNRETRSQVKEMSYKIIADNINKSPHMANVLEVISGEDQMISRDITRYRTK